MEKKSCSCAAKIKELKKDRDRLAEENSNILTISSSHQKINGELRSENTKLRKEIEHLKDPLNDFRKDGDL